jgi:hypothetical protein
LKFKASQADNAEEGHTGKGRHSIAGYYSNDSEIEFNSKTSTEYRASIKHEATNFDLLTLLGAVYAARAKELNPELNITRIRVVSTQRGSENNYLDETVTQMETEIAKMEMLVEQGGEDVPAEFKEIVEKYKESKGKEFHNNKMETVLRLLEFPATYREEHMFVSGMGEVGPKLKKELIEELHRAEDLDYYPHSLIEKLVELINFMKNSKADPDHDAGVELLTSLLRDVMDFSDEVNTWYQKSSPLHYLQSASTSGIEHMQKLENEYMAATGRTKQRYEKIQEEHRKLLKALYEEAGVNPYELGATKKVFGPLFEDELELDPAHVDRHFILKDPSKVKTEAQLTILYSLTSI